MSSVPVTRDLSLAPADNVRLVELCGRLDAACIRSNRGWVEVRRRGNRFQIIGLPRAAQRAEAVLRDLYARAQREPVDSERVHIALQELGMEGHDSDAAGGELKVNTARGAVRARGANPAGFNPRHHHMARVHGAIR